MQFIDLATQQQRIKADLDRRIQAVLAHGKYIMGPEVAELERQLAEYCGCRHAVGCASGTDALLMALMAAGVGPGDAVLTTPFTFIATAEVVRLLGARPVFADIDPHTFNLDVDKLEQAISGWRPDQGSLKAVIAVDLFGLPADYGRIAAVARAHGLVLIEDAAQSFGGRSGATMACAMGDIACTSFFPAKPLGCYGDGGMCFTGDERTAQLLDSIRVHGKGTDKYDNARVGINGRLDTLQAAVLLAKFAIFAEEVDLRQQVAQRYSGMIAAAGLPLTLQQIPSDCRSAWAQYSLLAASPERKSACQKALGEAGIPTAVYYPKPLHLQTAFADLGYRPGDFPVSEDASERIFSLPMHPYLPETDQQRIVDVMAGV